MIRILDYGLIRTTQKEFPKRLRILFSKLTSLIENWAPQEAAIEKIFLAQNAQSALKLGQARGVAMLTAALKQIPIAEYSSTEVKKAVTGYGRAEKMQVQKMVKMLLGLHDENLSEDVSDALAVAICHIHTCNY